MKLKTVYICEKCQYQSPKWIGKCPSCNAWNSFTEDVINVGKKDKVSKTPRRLAEKPQQLSKTKTTTAKFHSGSQEFDRVLGGGIVPGSLTLMSGEPGIGKSTLTLQIANHIAKDKSVLIVSGEESVEQIAQRAHRLELKADNLNAINEFNLENIIDTIKSQKPDFVIIDSIQVISSSDLPGAAGSISQVRYCTEVIMEFAKSSSTAILLIGHVTKDGNLAGPRVLEHLVDTVLYLEGDRFHQFRILRTVKNRFGSCSEVGIFEMQEKGLIEITNPSKQFLEGRRENAIGSSITATIEGTRPLLVEVQALVSTTAFGYPKRTANGFDLNRLQILIAVLEKHGKLKLQNQDVFINVVGGIKLSEPAADLAVLMAIASSLLKIPLPEATVVFGEVGLSGELRRTSHGKKRAEEAKRLGFQKIISPASFKEITSVLKQIHN